MTARESQFGIVRAWARMESSERIALSALIVAVLAFIATSVQVLIAWQTRNDAARSALRAEQLRACVTFQVTSSKFNARMLTLSEEPEDVTDAEGLAAELDQYQRDLEPLFYLLPSSDEPALEDAVVASAGAYLVFRRGERVTLNQVVADDGQLRRAHRAIVEACENVIRDVRDENVRDAAQPMKPAPS
jgi:hypothetical protein